MLENDTLGIPNDFLSSDGRLVRRYETTENMFKRYKKGSMSSEEESSEYESSMESYESDTDSQIQENTK